MNPEDKARAVNIIDWMSNRSPMADELWEDYRTRTFDASVLAMVVDSLLKGVEEEDIDRLYPLRGVIPPDIMAVPEVHNVLCNYLLRSVPHAAEHDPLRLSQHLSYLWGFLQQESRKDKYNPAAAQALDIAMPSLCARLEQEGAGDILKRSGVALHLMSNWSGTRSERPAQLERHRKHIENVIQQAGRYEYIVVLATRYGGGFVPNGQWWHDGDTVDQAINAITLPHVSRYIATTAHTTQQTYRQVIDDLLEVQPEYVNRNGVWSYEDQLGTDDLGVAIQIVNALTSYPLEDTAALQYATQRMRNLYQQHETRQATPLPDCPYTIEHLNGYVTRQALPEVARLLIPHTPTTPTAPSARTASCEQ